jgi:hypothetical protein
MGKQLTKETMSKKQYTVTTVERAAQPRSKRRQGASSSGGGGSVVVNGQSETSATENAQLAEQAHSHANKPLLDSLSDAEGYLLLRQKAEDADDSERGKVKAGYADEAGVADEARALSEDSEAWDMFLRKDVEDTAQERIHFTDGIDSGDYEAGGTGFGLTKDNDDNWLLEVDMLHVRQKLSAVELEIQKMSHVGGVIVASAASMVVSRVEPGEGVLVEGVSVVPWYKCYFNQEDAAGNQVVRTFQVGDLARCQTFHYKQSKNTQNKFYWRKVVAVGDDWVSLGNLPGEYAAESDWPEAGDHVVLLGNVSDTTRQNAIVIAGAGTGNPYIRIYTGINSFTLPNAEAQLSPHGSWITVTDRNGNRVRLDELVSSLEGMVTAAQDQADQMIEMWFGDVAPTLQNAPAVDWTDADTKALHEGDLYYNRGALQAGGGRAWVWRQVEQVWGWSELTDRDVLAALEAASHAQDTADGKRRVFVGQPTAPYDVGDLWVNATYPVIADNGNGNASVKWYDVVTGEFYGNGDIFNNDIVRCKTAKASGAGFSVWDWEPVQEMTTSKITQTANSIALEVINNNVLTGLRRIGIYINGQDDKILLSAATTEVSDDLVVKQLETKPDTSTNSENKACVKIGGSLMEVFNEYGNVNIRFGVDNNGYSIMQFLNESGDVIYDLGVNGMSWNQLQGARFESHNFYFLNADPDAVVHAAGTSAILYLYYAKRINSTILADGNNITAALAEEANGLWFTSGSYSGIIDNGALTNKVTGLYRSPDSLARTIRSIAKYGSIQDLQDYLTAEYGVTDFSGFDFTLEDNGELLEYPIYVQEYIMFNNGVRSTRVDVWQELPAPEH